MPISSLDEAKRESDEQSDAHYEFGKEEMVDMEAKRQFHINWKEYPKGVWN